MKVYIILEWFDNGYFLNHSCYRDWTEMLYAINQLRIASGEPGRWTYEEWDLL